jgi:hypothetical protein
MPPKKRSEKGQKEKEEKEAAQEKAEEETEKKGGENREENSGAQEAKELKDVCVFVRDNGEALQFNISRSFPDKEKMEAVITV